MLLVALWADTAPSHPEFSELKAVYEHEYVKLIWDKKAESSIDPLTGYSDFEGYRIYRSSDGGNNWKMVNDPSDEGHGTAKRIVFDDPMTSWKSALGFYNLHFPTSTHGWGVGEMGKIAHTSDGGKNWLGQSTNNPQIDFSNLFGVYFVDTNTGWTVGAGGAIAKTNDGGKMWQAQYGCSEELRSVFALNVDIAWIVGSQGAIYATQDGGSTWIRQIAPTDENLHGVTFADSETGWVIGSNGVILQTTDGGITWLMQASPTKNNLSGIAQSADGTVWAIGEWGTIIAAQ